MTDTVPLPPWVTNQLLVSHLRSKMAKEGSDTGDLVRQYETAFMDIDSSAKKSKTLATLRAWVWTAQKDHGEKAPTNEQDIVTVDSLINQAKLEMAQTGSCPKAAVTRVVPIERTTEEQSRLDIEFRVDLSRIRKTKIVTLYGTGEWTESKVREAMAQAVDVMPDLRWPFSAAKKFFLRTKDPEMACEWAGLPLLPNARKKGSTDLSLVVDLSASEPLGSNSTLSLRMAVPRDGLLPAVQFEGNDIAAAAAKATALAWIPQKPPPGGKSFQKVSRISAEDSYAPAVRAAWRSLCRTNPDPAVHAGAFDGLDAFHEKMLAWMPWALRAHQSAMVRARRREEADVPTGPMQVNMVLSFDKHKKRRRPADEKIEAVPAAVEVAAVEAAKQEENVPSKKRKSAAPAA